MVVMLFGISMLMFQYATSIKHSTHGTDSAQVVEMINTTFTDGIPRSQSNWSALQISETNFSEIPGKRITYMSIEPDKLCAMPLQVGYVESTFMLERHAYVINYLLAPFRTIASGTSIATWFHAFTFIGLIFGLYVFMRKEQLPIAGAVLFSLAVISHPAWSESVFGQLYPDRFFIFIGFLYAVLLYKRFTGKDEYTLAIILTAILGIIITERAAIMIGGFTLASLIAYRGIKRWTSQDLPLLGIGITAVVYAILYMGLMQDNPMYSSFSGRLFLFFESINNDEVFRLKLGKFLLVNAPLMVLALFEWRLAMIAFGAMLPNILGNIGGAEKIGWSTHYHSMYFPFLIAAANVGFIRLWRLSAKYCQQGMLSGFMVIVVVLMLTIKPYALFPIWSFNASFSDTQISLVLNNAVIKVVSIVSNLDLTAYNHIQFAAKQSLKVADAIPRGATVSTTSGIPALIDRGISILNYPHGLASADYIVNSYSLDKNDQVQLSGATTYLGAKKQAQLNDCLNARIWQAGFKLEQLVPLVDEHRFGIAILKRTTTK